MSHSISKFRTQIRGFTLLELVIAIMIMTVISVLTANGIDNSMKNKEKIHAQIERLATLRDGLRLVDVDIRRAFHFRDLNKEMIEAINLQRKNQNPTSPSPPPQSGGNPPKGQPPGATSPTQALQPLPVPNYPNLTHFIGEKESLHFTNLNHVRTTADAQESIQQEVGYYLEKCTSLGSSHQSQCLWRRTSGVIDDDVTKGGEAMPLVENVVEFKLRYFGPGRDEWVEVWKSDERGDSLSQGNFPYAVEVTMATQNQEIKGDRKVTMTMVSPLDFPNNIDPKDKKGDGSGQAGSGSGGASGNQGGGNQGSSGGWGSGNQGGSGGRGGGNQGGNQGGGWGDEYD